MVFVHLEGRLVEEGRLSIHHLYEHDAEGPDVHLRTVRQPGYHLHTSKYPLSICTVLKYLNFLDADTDPGSFWPWIRDGTIRLRNKHPRSATLPASILNSDLIATGAGIRIQIWILDMALSQDWRLVIGRVEPCKLWTSISQSTLVHNCGNLSQ